MTRKIAVQALFSLYIQELPIYNIKMPTSLQLTPVLLEHNKLKNNFLKPIMLLCSQQTQTE